MECVYDKLIGKMVKLVYKDGVDAEGKDKLKIMRSLKFVGHDGSAALFELDKEGEPQTIIPLADIKRMTEK